MTEDRSLDEFADAGSDRNDRSGSSEESAAGGETDAPAETDAEQTDAEQTDAEQTDAEQTDAEQTDAEENANPVEPAMPTATWSSNGVACDRCDAVVERRWLEDDAQLCADCKEW